MQETWLDPTHSIKPSTRRQSHRPIESKTQRSSRRSTSQQHRHLYHTDQGKFASMQLVNPALHQEREDTTMNIVALESLRAIMVQYLPTTKPPNRNQNQQVHKWQTPTQRSQLPSLGCCSGNFQKHWNMQLPLSDNRRGTPLCYLFALPWVLLVQLDRLMWA